MTRSSIAWATGALLALTAPTALLAEDMVGGAYAVTVSPDVVYGQGMVGATSAKPHLRDLKLDIYRPTANGKPVAGRPAVVLAFGGAFLRGSKGTMRFEEDGASDSSMGDWCQTLAAAGYVCLSIEYRLMPEDPALPAGLDPAVLMPKAMLKDPVATARIDVIRGRMGLPLLDDSSREQLWNTVFAAAQDLSGAVGYARSHAAELGIDPDRIAVGGFSAGGASAVNVAYGQAAPVKAVISFSGGVAGFNLASHDLDLRGAGIQQTGDAARNLCVKQDADEHEERDQHHEVRVVEREERTRSRQRGRCGQHGNGGQNSGKRLHGLTPSSAR